MGPFLQMGIFFSNGHIYRICPKKIYDYMARARARAPVTSMVFFKNDTKLDIFLSANLMTD